MKKCRTKCNFYKILLGTAFTFTLLLPQYCFSMEADFNVDGEYNGDNWGVRGNLHARLRSHGPAYQSHHSLTENNIRVAKRKLEKSEEKLGDAEDRLEKQKKSFRRREENLKEAKEEFSELADMLVPIFSMKKQEVYDLLRGYEKKEIKLEFIWEKMSEEGKICLGLTSKDELEKKLQEEWCPVRHEVGKTKWHKDHSKKYLVKRQKQVSDKEKKFKVAKKQLKKEKKQ